MDKFLKRKEIGLILKIKDTTLKAMIKNNQLIKPIYIEGFSEPLFSEIELEEWMELQKAKRRTPSLSSANNQERA